MKTIIITGGGRGIGAATATLAAREGYAVAINYRSNELAATSLVREIQKKGGRAFAIRADITSETEVENLFLEVSQQFGTIDILVNNAGILQKQMLFKTMDLPRIKRTFDTNVFGQMLCARVAIKYMSSSNGGQGGSIINVSSMASITGAPNEYVDYAASKGAIDTFTKGLAKEVANEGIRVNAVRPAFIYTDMHADGGEPDRVNRIRDSIPLKRGGLPEEVAEAILWLASEKASFCTGTCIDVCGGK